MGLGKACLGLALAIAPQGAQAAADAGVAKDILMRSVAYRTVQGAGQVPKLAAYYADVLKSAGFADGDIVIRRDDQGPGCGTQALADDRAYGCGGGRSQGLDA